MARLKLWYGMRAGAWLRLLGRHALAIDRSRAGVAALATLLSARNSAMGAVQWAVRSIRPGPPLPPDPIVVLGHWRCGTTLLHELLSVDPRHVAPGTYACLAPSHFRVTGPLTMRLMARWLPGIHRPMDRMPVGWDSPQEDDLAMLALGCPSVYEHIAFPRGDRAIDAAHLDTPRWRRALTVFLRDVLAQRAGRLVLKSPMHMMRIPALLELFPRAVFVHVVRDPYDVFPSAVHMWTELQREHGLQRDAGQVEAFVLDAFVRLHQQLEADRPRIPAHRFAQVRYEDLIRRPRQILSELYERLRLGPFAPARPSVESYLDSVRGYESNRYALPPATAALVTARWQRIIDRDGYARRGGAARALHAG